MSAPTSSGLGIAAATVSPKLSYEIGQYFKSNDSEGSATHILAHTVLGAAVAAAGGNDALLAGVTAGGAEASAPLLSKYLYGKEAKDLTADEKGTVSAITGLVASGVGGSTGDVASSVQSGQVAQNAVENNGFSIIDENYGQVVKENTKEKFSCPTGYVCPIPEKTLGEKTLLVINDLTIRQLAAAMGAEYDPITKEHFTPKEIQEAKVAMLGLGFSKTLSGPIKLTDEAFENIGKKYGSDITKLLKEPEADFAGRIPVRPRDGYTEVGTSQIDTPLGKHLIDATVNKKSKIISGGHNADNFYDVLKSSGGKVIGNPNQVTKGISDIKYQLPNGRVETKTVYDPKVYSDKQMAMMANEAAAKAIVN